MYIYIGVHVLIHVRVCVNINSNSGMVRWHDEVYTNHEVVNEERE